jgi:ATP-binding cassette, subfamily B, bacterial
MTARARSTGPARTASVMLRLAWTADPRRAVLAFGLLGLQALVASLFAWWLKLLLDALAPVDPDRIVLAASGIAASIAGGAVLNYTGQRVQMVLRESTRTEVDRHLIDLVGGAPTLEIHETPAHLDQLQALERDSWHLGQVIPTLLEFFTTAIRIVIAAVLLFNVHPALLLLPVFGLPALLLSSKTGGLFRLGNDRAAAPARMAHHLYELATNGGPAKEVRLFRLGDELTARFHRTQLEIQRIHRRVNAVGQGLGLVGRITFLIGYFAAIAFVVTRAVSGQASVGDTALTAVLAGQVLGLVTGSADMVQLGFRNLATAGRFVYLSDVARRTHRHIDPNTPTPNRLTDGIRLDHVSYRYPLAATDTLHDINLHLPAGATIAVVGDNGAGKTTLIKLLAGLYQPTHGQISIDGTDLAALDPDRWRQKVSAGFQDHARFEFLAREAVGIGDLNSIDDPPVVAAALDRAGATDILQTLPAGLETQLGPNWPDGIDLSGGQWQKIALGRAMMRRQPLLLLLDEPTAALDADTEHRLFEHWTSAATHLRQTTGAITLLVSHRFSTVRMADHIIVLDNGHITETGSHGQLLARNGLYAELFNLQAHSYR